MFDILILNGMVVDGTGNPWFEADVGIKDGRIVALGDFPRAAARETIDAKNKIVSPGFIDVHSHSDYLILANPTAESKVCVGVTTDISGNCGGSAAPQTDKFWQEWWTEDVDERFKLVSRAHATETLRRHGVDFDWHTMGEYLSRVQDKGISLNYANFVGHYTLRIAAYGSERRKPSAGELQKMKELLAQGISEGALGFSTEVGSHFIWEYEYNELFELCQLTKAMGGVFSYDINNYGDAMLADLETALWVIEKTGVPTIISHIQTYGRENAGKSKYVLDMIEDTRSRGFNVVADVMPAANGGGLFFSARATDMLPEWAIKDLTNVLGTADLRARLKAELEEGRSSVFYVSPTRTEEERAANMVYSHGPLMGRYWHHYLTVVKSSCPELVGKTIATLAREWDKERYETLFKVLTLDPDVRTLLKTVHEDNMRDVICHPLVAFGTDGGLAGAIRRPRIPNPTLYTSFPMVIRKYVREDKVLRLEECIRKMSSLPATAMRLYDRGLIRPGFRADCVVFDLNEIAEIPCYGDEKPSVYAKGIEHVIVNGEVVVKHGQHTGARPGMVLRSANNGRND